ncbi:MAG TPA: LysM peptidoglycan-binding domain-containing protein [Kiritimatiellia bacterium]|nr:LysM peptidoglycan-binding domain-containing protein [Kiritimatiellia bacterium]
MRLNSPSYWLTGLILTLGLMTLALAQTSHTVRTGETLDAIGKQYGVSPSAIARANEIDNPNRIRTGMELKIPDGANAPVRYEVKPGDTLGSIAVAHGTTTKALIEANEISRPDRLRVGDSLVIPSGGKSPVVARHPLPESMRRLLDATPVTPNKWRYIVIHHSATANGSLQGMEMYHRQKRRMENGLAYHFVIGNGRGMPDGQIEIGNRWKRQIKGGHLANDAMNEVAIGICLIGNFEVDRPTEAQMRSLYALVSYLNRRCNIPKSRVQTHQQINTKPTACPGKLFPSQTFIRNL